MALIYLPKYDKELKYKNVLPKEVLKCPRTTAIGTCSSEGSIIKATTYHTVPAWRAAANVSALSMSLVKTAAAKP